MPKTTAPDRLDLRIVAALGRHGRLTMLELSQAVGLSPTPCKARLEWLEAQRFILGYRADIEIERLADLSQYFVTLTAKSASVELTGRIEELLLANPYVVRAEALFGAVDYLIVVYARSTKHYHELMAPLLALLLDYHTWVVSHRVKPLPAAAQDRAGRCAARLDALDWRILSALAVDGRQTIACLSRTVGLTPTPCTTRLHKLEADGYIRGYHADVDMERLSACNTYYCSLSQRTPTAQSTHMIESMVAAAGNVLLAARVYGSLDFILCFQARSSRHFNELLQPFIARNVEYQTWPVSRIVFRPRLHQLVAHLAAQAGDAHG